MKWLILFCILAFPALIMAQTPTLVQWGGDANSLTLASNTEVHAFAQGTKSGNAILVFVTTNDSPIGNITVTDDKSGGSSTYSVIKSFASGGQFVVIFGTFNIASGIKTITANYNTGGQTNEMVIQEWQNLSTTGATDTSGCSAHLASGTTMTCGSFTTATSGDLVCQAVYVLSFSSNPVGSMTWTAQAGGAWNLYSADGTSYFAVQCEVQASAGAVNPAIVTSSAVTSANTVGIAIKAATSGSALSGTYVKGFTVINIPQSAAVPTSTTVVVQFPCYGNNLALSWDGYTPASNPQTISGITDTNSNTWVGRTISYRNGASGNLNGMQWWTADSATCSSTEKLTITFNNTPNGNSGAEFPIFGIYDIVNGGGYDSTAGTQNAHGTSAITSGTITGASLTPSTSNGVVLGFFQLDDQTAGGISPGTFVGGLLDSSVYAGNLFHQDGGYTVYNNPNTSSVSSVWTINNSQGATAVGDWWTSTIAFKAPAAGGAPHNQFPRLQ